MGLPCDYYFKGRKLTYDQFRKELKGLPMSEIEEMFPTIKDEGIKSIAWTTGEQQNDRYDLSKTIEQVAVIGKNENDGKSKRVTLIPKSGETINMNVSDEGLILTGDYKNNKLEDVIGKELSEKVLKSNDNQKTRFEGNDLKVGGKGMKGFYGSPTEGSLGIVGNVAKSLFKQEPKTVSIDVNERGKSTKDFDGLKESLQFEKQLADKGKTGIVSTVNKDGSYTIEWNENKPTTQYSIDITPELKASVEDGLPLFKKGESEKDFGGFKTRDGKPIGYTYDTDKVARERFDISKLKKIGSGSDRDVYDLGDGRVLKIAKTARGLTQNIYEGDYYLKGIIPEVTERGLNYVVAENTPRIKTSDVVEIFDEDGNAIGTGTAGQMLKELQQFSQRDFDNRVSKLQDVLYKYGFYDIMNYDVLFGDFIAQRNWGYKDGKAYHSDGGTFGGVDMITSFKGKTNLSDPEFRKIYEESKRLKKEFGDMDKATMYKEEEGEVQAQYRIESGKNVVEAIEEFNGSPRAVVALTHEIMHPTVVAIIDGAKDGNEVGTRHTKTIVDEFNKVVQEKNKQLKLSQDAAENEYANSKLTKEDNIEQEPSIKAIESKAESNDKTELNEVIEQADAKINVATDVKTVPLKFISTDEARFQNRNELNKQVVDDIAKNWSDANQDPIHVWTDPKNGKTYVLSGHHRFYGAKEAGRESVKIVDRTNDFTEVEAIKFAKEEANANRSMESSIERAKALREKIKRGDSKEEINKFLEREGKNKTYVQNVAALNPKGKTMQTIEQFGNAGDRQTQKETEQRADWIGEARRTINGLTNAHENEMFDFLFDKDASKRITTKADFLQKVRSVVKPLEPNEPLNIARFKNKTQGEAAYDEDVNNKKAEIADKQEKINAINDRFSNPQNKDYIPTNSNEYENARKIADNKISQLESERKIAQKQLEDIYRDKGKYTGAASSGTLFKDDSGIQFEKEITAEDLIKWNDDFKAGKTNDQYRAVQEFIAENWEKYHTEGAKGFSKAFQEVLEQISKAFQAVYSTLKGEKVTPELRQMFDEILGKDKTTKNVTDTTPTSGTTKKERIDTFNKKADEAANALIDFLTPKTTKGVKKSGLGVAEIVNGATSVIKATYAATQNIKEAIDAGLQYFRDNWDENELGELPIDAVRAKLQLDFLGGMTQPENPAEGVSMTHAATAETLNEFMLPEYQKEAQTLTQWDAEAVRRIESGEMPALLEKLRNFGDASPVEVRMLGMYIANLKTIASQTKSDEDIAIMYEAIKLSDMLGSKEGKALRARRGLFLNGDTLADYFQEEMDAIGTDTLTENQKSEIEKEYEAIKQAKEEWEKERERLNVKVLELEAQAALKKEVAKAAKKSSKNKTPQDFSKEREKIFEDIKQKLKDARKGTSVTIVPYANELFAIAPDVAKLVRNLVEEGVVTLTEIVASIKENLSQEIPQITDSDVRDLVAGAYNQKVKTKKQLSTEIFEIKEEARLINKLAALEAGELPKTEKARIERNKNITNLREQIEKFRRDNPTDKERLGAVKKSYETRIKQIEEDLRTGNFNDTPTVRPPVKLDAEAIAAKDKLVKLQNERKLRILRAEYANKSKVEKGRDVASNILNIPRALMTTLDFSAVLKQGIIPTVSGLLSTNPKRIFNALGQMFKSGFSKKEYDRWFFDVEQSPDYEVMKDSGLALTDNASPNLLVREEVFMSNFVSKIPLVGYVTKVSERSYSAYLNKIRVDLFRSFANAMEERGMTYDNSTEAYEQLAKYVNNATGRGGLPKVAGADLNTISPLLNGIFFSPRLISSRLNMLTYFAQSRFYTKVPKEVRNSYFADMAKFIGLGVSVLAVASMAGGDGDDEDKLKVEIDPRGSDFGKIRSGNSRWDIWGGFQPFIRVLAQVLSGERKSTKTGEIIEINGEGAFGTSRADVITSFARSKLSPVPAMAVGILSKRTSGGDKIIWEINPSERSRQITILNYLGQHLLPLTVTGLSDAIKENGVKALLTTGLPSIFGVGVQSYGNEGIEIIDDLPKVGPKQLERLEANGIKTLEDLKKYKGRLKTLKYKDDEGDMKRIFTAPQVKSIDSIFRLPQKPKK